jgi:hypothetical protein
VPSREEDIAQAVRIFETASYPSGKSAATAWLGIYQALLWCEPIDPEGRDKLPHIVHADKLRPTARAQAAGQRPGKGIWTERAKAVEAYVASQLRCEQAEVKGKIGLLFGLPPYAGMQKQNPLGIAFAGLIAHILRTFSRAGLSYELEVSADTIYPGIQFPGRSKTPSIDILVRSGGQPSCVISLKWSLRHDRINDITNECPIYKAAALRHRQKLSYYVVTNEFDPARLDKVLSDTCIDGLVHVHKPAVTDVCQLNGRLDRLMDLSDFIARFA